MRNFFYLVRNLNYAEELFRQYRIEKYTRSQRYLRQLERELRWSKP